jgi:glucan phosphoethanolaminetransferase (alkaline phosphatase superfamily)
MVPDRISGILQRTTRQVAVALLCTLVILAEHKLFYTLHPSLSDMVEFKHFVNIGIAYLLFSFIRSPRARLAAYLAPPLFTFIERMHQAYFGAQIHPIEIWHFFIQFGEVSESMFGSPGLFLLPIALTAAAMAAILVIRKLDHGLFRIKYWGWLIVLLLLIEPYKNIFQGNDFGKHPSVTVIESYNLFGSFTFFLTEIVPAKAALRSGAASVVVQRPVAMEEAVRRNVIFVIGESVRLKNMSLFGYAYDTTPFLLSMAGKRGFVYRRAVASGVSTDVAMPYLLNVLSGPNQVGNILSGNWSLFSMAKSRGMKTYFFSTQSADSLEHIINYICPDSIDVLKAMDHFKNSGPLPRADDHSLIEQLAGVDFGGSNFVVLHQRGCHSPYRKRAPESMKRFTGRTDGPRGHDIDDYDDCIRYEDHFFGELFSFLERQAGSPIYLIFTSDHGQALGEDGRFGHSFFHEAVYSVPFVFNAFGGEDRLVRSAAALPQIVRHYDVAMLAAELLGFRMPDAAPLSEPYYVSGLDLGFENGRWVRISGDTVRVEP